MTDEPTPEDLEQLARPSQCPAYSATATASTPWQRYLASRRSTRPSVKALPQMFRPMADAVG